MTTNREKKKVYKIYDMIRNEIKLFLSIVC